LHVLGLHGADLPAFADLFRIYARRDLAIRLLAGGLDGAGAVLALPAGRNAWLRSGARESAGKRAVVCAVALWAVAVAFPLCHSGESRNPSWGPSTFIECR